MMSHLIRPVDVKPRLLWCLLFVLIAASVTIPGRSALAQRGTVTLFGDMKVDESKAGGMRAMSFNVILYNLSGNVLGRQTVPSGGRYRFNNVRSGEYDIAIEVENNEIARVRVMIAGSVISDFRQDLEFEWKPGAGAAASKPPKAQTISAADVYPRAAPNQTLFDKGQSAVDGKRYDEAVVLLEKLLAADPNDFQAWTELGTVHLLRHKAGEAEKAYRRAVEARPTFGLASLNLGRILASQKKFEEAVEPLARVVELQPQNAEAHLLLGEAYLQTKKGSKAVGHLNEAARLGRAEAHLRLATLYNAVGMKDKAAAEYEQFLAKQPTHPGRKKLEAYITANKKP